ncbi:MAG: cell envelope integrity protein TolA, partial [Pseudomonadota bacterium]
MLSFIKRHPISVILALILHIVIGVLITYEWQDSTKPIKVSVQGEDEGIAQQNRQNNQFPKSEPLKTFAVDSTLITQQLERIKAEESAKKLEQQQLAAKTDKERQRLQELQLRQKEALAKAEQAQKLTAQQKLKTEAERKKTEAERKKTEDAKRLATLEKQKADVERVKAAKAKEATLLAEKQRKLADEKTLLAEKKRLLEERKKKALEAEIALKDKENKALAIEAEKAKQQQAQASAAASLQRQLEEEAAAQRASQKRQQLLSLRETYISSISSKVKDNWRTPARISPEAQCELKITQTPQGNVTSVKILNCNTHATEQFQSAAEKAVYRSEP